MSINEKRCLIDYDELMIEWDWNKNNELGLDPAKLGFQSNKNAWWVCNEGHRWESKICNRVNGRDCPYCANKKVLKGYNDLATTNPELAAQWHPTKNKNLTPFDVTHGSHKKVWWMCDLGHEYEATIYNRSNGRGCPVCNNEMQTSFPEQSILFYCRKITKAESRNTEFGKEIDIYLPEYKIGIEYNGQYWHRNRKEADKNKVDFFKANGIRIISILESNDNDINGDIIQYVYNQSLDWCIKQVFKLIGVNSDFVDTSADRQKIYTQYINSKKENSLGIKFPELAKEWDQSKNGAITPYMISCGSEKIFWWKCSKCGHEWQACIINRTTGRGCPKCKLKTISDKNSYTTEEGSLSAINPKLAAEWNYTKNGDLKPNQVKPNSHKKVWWKCNICNNEWEATIKSRNQGNGCPECGKNKISINQRKPVLCVELNQIFGSAKQAEMAMCVKNITANCRGKYSSAGKHPITNEKLHWYYVYDQLQKDGSAISGAITLGLITEKEALKILEEQKGED